MTCSDLTLTKEGCSLTGQLDSLRNRSADVLTDEYDQVLSISHEKDAYYFLLDILLLFREFMASFLRR